MCFIILIYIVLRQTHHMSPLLLFIEIHWIFLVIGFLTLKITIEFTHHVTKGKWPDLSIFHCLRNNMFRQPMAIPALVWGFIYWAVNEN